MQKVGLIDFWSEEAGISSSVHSELTTDPETFGAARPTRYRYAVAGPYILVPTSNYLSTQQGRIYFITAWVLTSM